ncbi:MAG: hypothetical protein ACP5N2_05945 [Candidatus Nanoarchaeia archaeon]
MHSEKNKQFIEDTLNEHFMDLSENTKFRDHTLYRFWNALHHSINARTSYEIILEFEKGENVLEKFDFGLGKTNNGGIPVSLDKVSKNIWIPKNYISRMHEHGKDKFYMFTLFDEDVYNSLLSQLNEEESDLTSKILYCKGKNGEKLGNKADLFLNDSSWRKSAKEFCVLLLQKINAKYNNQEINNLYSNHNPEKAKRANDASALISEMYLSELK